LTIVGGQTIKRYIVASVVYDLEGVIVYEKTKICIAKRAGICVDC
jgi:hypothetical protein